MKSKSDFGPWNSNLILDESSQMRLESLCLCSLCHKWDLVKQSHFANPLHLSVKQSRLNPFPTPCLHDGFKRVGGGEGEDEVGGWQRKRDKGVDLEPVFVDVIDLLTFCWVSIHLQCMPRHELLGRPIAWPTRQPVRWDDEQDFH